MIVVVIAIVLIAAAVSTPKTRAAGRAMVAPWGRRLALVTCLVWAAILLPELFR